MGKQTVAFEHRAAIHECTLFRTVYLLFSFRITGIPALRGIPWNSVCKLEFIMYSRCVYVCRYPPFSPPTSSVSSFLFFFLHRPRYASHSSSIFRMDFPGNRQIRMHLNFRCSYTARENFLDKFAGRH